MVEIELVQSLLDKYATLEDKDDDYIGEIAFLNILNEEFKWNLLTDLQKQQARKERNAELLNKLYKDYDDQNMKYESTVIDLYDYIITYKNLLEPYVTNNELLFRLFSILVIEKNLIDQKRRICNIKHINRELINNAFLKLKDNEIAQKLNVKFLADKFEEMYVLLPKESYRI